MPGDAAHDRHLVPSEDARLRRHAANWKGWAAAIGYVVGIVGATVLLLSPQSNSAPPSSGRILFWAVLVGVATAAFIRLCKARTDGAWRWR